MVQDSPDERRSVDIALAHPFGGSQRWMIAPDRGPCTPDLKRNPDTFTWQGARADVAHSLGGCVMTIGTVRWFDVPKGYGFIKPDDGGVDVLVSICALERAGIASLDQGQRVSFDVVRDERIGTPRAVNLSVSGLQAATER